ncbi:excalibur calcium-binding domain-containing protein [Mycobacterium sp. ITM-2016-00317]|jgi:hypothetical protein|uniref:excalibur calcium-binding domain-containing protein n=1 Tax=Mycobacterium sp. ITM-2016-00317 TaxID=2099694 RepID=UPI000D46C3F8|nr:excalibur calcium-binding domain-containing protein [Mycobacterium sp. ITM-2016-00317]WNG85807.1 excalibur calcium-binding domain-containing protein [Mycobacterium sp. ITM-2016-00317]
MILRFLFVVAATGAIALGAPATAGAVPFSNCTAARDAGYEDIPRGSEFYGPHLDRDNDGIGCES